MPALVLEGGTFRPIFSAGVMDALLDCGVEFPYIIGVSAGNTNGISYVSNQKKRNYDVLMNLRHDKRYVGWRNFFTERSLFGIKFAYETMPRDIYPFDWDAFNASPAQVRVGVTNLRTGASEYLDGKAMCGDFSMLVATCAIPFVFPACKWKGETYYDGGICDPIPVRKAIADGHEKLLIVLTRPKEYKKKLSRANVFAHRYFKKKYPQFAERLLTRHNTYNETVAYCEQLECEGRAVLLRPSAEVQIDSLERDLEKIDRIYHFGYAEAMRRIEEIKELLLEK